MGGLTHFFNTYFMNMLELLTGYYFFNRFLGKKTLLIPSVFFSVMAFIVLLYFPWGETGRLTIYITIFYSIGKFTSQGFRVEKRCQPVLFYSFVIVAVIHLCNGIMNSLCGIMSAKIIISHPGIIFFLLTTGNMLLSFFLIILCYKLIEKYKILDEADRGTYGLIFLTPVLLILLVSEYIGSHLSSSTVTIETDRIVEDTNYYPVFFVQILGTVSLLGIVYAYKKLQDGFRLQKKISLMEQESRFMHQYVEEARMRYEKTKSFRHDIRNHITVVKELLQNNTPGSGNGDAALQYLNSMQEMSEDLAFSVSTGRPVLDILLGNKLGFAEASQIETECSLTVPDHCRVNDLDFCILLSNALDSYDQRERIIWGTGLGNIRTVAEKYHGAAETGTEKGVFTLSVLIDIDD